MFFRNTRYHPGWVGFLLSRIQPINKSIENCSTVKSIQEELQYELLCLFSFAFLFIFDFGVILLCSAQRIWLILKKRPTYEINETFPCFCLFSLPQDTVSIHTNRAPAQNAAATADLSILYLLFGLFKVLFIVYCLQLLRLRDHAFYINIEQPNLKFSTD